MNFLLQLFNDNPEIPTEYLYHFFFGTAISCIVNGLIILLFAGGTLIVVWGRIRIWRENRALKEIRELFLEADKQQPRELLDKIENAGLSRKSFTIQAVKDIQAVKRLDGNVEIIADALKAAYIYRSSWGRYIAGNLIILGLIGTILGLSQAVINLRGILMGMGSVVSRDAFQRIISDMLGSLGFMETAFSSTLCGFFAFLLLSFVNHVYERAKETFGEEFESFTLNILIPFFTPKKVEDSLDTIANVMKLSGSGLVEISSGIADLMTLITDNQDVHSRMADTLYHTVDGITRSQTDLEAHYLKISDANETFVKLSQGLARHLENSQASIEKLFDGLGGQKSEIENLYARLETSIQNMDKNFKEGLLEASSNIIHAVDFQNQQIQRIEADHNSFLTNTNNKMIQLLDKTESMLKDQQKLNIENLKAVTESHVKVVDSLKEIHQVFNDHLTRGFEGVREEIAAQQGRLETRFDNQVTKITTKLDDIFSQVLPKLTVAIENQTEAHNQSSEQLIERTVQCFEAASSEQRDFFSQKIIPSVAVMEKTLKHTENTLKNSNEVNQALLSLLGHAFDSNLISKVEKKGKLKAFLNWFTFKRY
ncbi:MAG: hypothetical protein KAV83_08115 [Desulfobacterales bacterium]|nr:hypothetical protein [Desulfobacterales bacterium]